MASKFGRSPGVAQTSAYFTVPSASMTKAARLLTPNISNAGNVSYNTPYALAASLLKSLNNGKFRFCSLLNLSRVKSESTEIPNTCALVLLYKAILSLTLQSSAVQTPVNARGKNNKTTGFAFCSSRLTFCFSVLKRENDGAFCPT